MSIFGSMPPRDEGRNLSCRWIGYGTTSHMLCDDALGGQPAKCILSVQHGLQEFGGGFQIRCREQLLQDERRGWARCCFYLIACHLRQGNSLSKGICSKNCGS